MTAAALFREGKALMDAGHIAEGCRKLEASRQLDPAPGTILNLAYCHEQEGKTATAMTEYDEAIALAKRDNRQDRVQFASGQMAALAPKLSRLTIAVPEASAIAELVIARDGSVVPRAAWNTALAVDPGEHAIEASAKGRKGWSTKITLAATADQQTVTVPLLEPLPAEPPPPEPPPPAPTGSAVPLAITSAPPSPPPHAHHRATLGYALGAAGIVSVGVGSYFGLRALSKKNESDRTCPTATTCDGPGYGANQDAKSAADVATVTIALGLVGIGLGTYFVLSDKPDPSPTARVRVDIGGAPGGGTVSLSGRF